MRLKCYLAFLMFVFGTASIAHAAVQKYHLAKDRSKLEFVGHGSFWGAGFDVIGHFKQWDVKAAIIDKKTEKVEVKVDIDTASFTTENSRRDKHIRTSDFLSVEVFPKASFTLSEVKKGEGGERTIVGKLVLRGIEKDLTFPVKISSDEVKSKPKYHFSGNMSLNRKDFGMTYQPPFPLPRVKDEVDVKFDLWLEPDSE
jgi:polyisoprenoid-binding protein YceI